MPNYPDFEIRKPRTVFTRKLKSICMRLDAKDTAKETFKFFYGESSKEVTVKVLQVWVVGSYARGAATCGDLDIVVSLDNQSIPTSRVNRALLGALPDVRCYCGDPKENSSGVEFSEAKLIWQAGEDWESRIAAIEQYPEAGRFYRPTDEIPFRLEQLNICVSLAENYLEDRKLGFITWSFTPLSAIEPKAAFDVFECLEGLPKKCAALPAYLEGFAVKKYPAAPTSWEPYYDAYAKGSLCIAMGFVPNLSPLDNPGISAIAVMPSLSTRGPNGVWLLERGPNHWLNKVVVGKSIFAVKDGRGPLALIVGDGCHVSKSVALFRSKDDVAEYLDDSFTPDIARNYSIVELRGTEILKHLEDASSIELYRGEEFAILPLTREAELAWGDESITRPNRDDLEDLLEDFLTIEVELAA